MCQSCQSSIETGGEILGVTVSIYLTSPYIMFARVFLKYPEEKSLNEKYVIEQREREKQRKWEILNHLIWGGLNVANNHFPSFEVRRCEYYM